MFDEESKPRFIMLTDTPEEGEAQRKKLLVNIAHITSVHQDDMFNEELDRDVPCSCVSTTTRGTLYVVELPEEVFSLMRRAGAAIYT